MGLFGRRNKANKRCPDCKFYFLVEGKGYCAQGVPSSVDVRYLSGDGVKRQCTPCPTEMTCENWQAK